MVASSLSTVPGAKVFQTNGALAHPLSHLAVWPWRRGERRLFQPPPCHTVGNSYILLFTDRCSCRADMSAVSAAEFTAEGTADILVNKYIPLCGCLASILSDNGLEFCSKLPVAVYKLLGMWKIVTSAYHLNGNGGVERQPHHGSDAGDGRQRRQDDWDVHLLQVEFAYHNSVSAATGLTPNEVHMNRLPRFPCTIYARGHQSLACYHLEYCDLAADRQQRAYAPVREQHALTISRVERRNSALSDALTQPIYTVGE